MLMVFIVIPRQAVRHLIIMVVIGKIPLNEIRTRFYKKKHQKQHLFYVPSQRGY